MCINVFFYRPGPLRYPYAPAVPRGETSGPRSPRTVQKNFLRAKKQYGN